MRRTATRDVELGGASVKAGDKVLLWFPAGNRDDQVIERADVFDVQRGPVDLLTFGKGGPHYCMGSHLARLELKVTLQELTARLGSACLAGDPERLRSNFVNGVKRLPVSVSER
jgi:cytochrome P450